MGKDIFSQDSISVNFSPNFLASLHTRPVVQAIEIIQYTNRLHCHLIFGLLSRKNKKFLPLKKNELESWGL